ncbi:tRNA lysidine(34) synthetase TilS [Aureitalea sp. L0-47]|uniref:tRNA lysidine(34) synthetase TilS n=1 Tax=Aureitalea sp. L0-47 TaxID=2816962 RepID=UPI002238C3F9|nr:tRNA lysidine(34) synthetase TilS [Aureitalea sp. L0-47]MCW5520605.1 tRNA lysidine(34) synthetase TilS [Aureitalea sp. L0-47]
MLEKLREHIAKNMAFLEGKKLLVACSGGLDSVFLARSFHELGYELGLAHCNFGLRGKESDGDAEFVSELAEMLTIPFYEELFQTESYAKKEKLSIQMAARELRYAWFEEIREDFDYDHILTAHHADDSLETFLINLSRGSGIRGLTGIPAITDYIVRPLLPFSREEILTYAKEKGYFWREDSSNAKSDYLRNALRHEVIPPMKNLVKGLLDQVATAQAHLRESEALVKDYMALVQQLVISETEDGYALDIEKLSELPNPDALLYELLNPFGFTAWKDITALPEAQSGKTITSPTHRIIKDRNRLLITEIPAEQNEQAFEIDNRTTRIDQPLPIIFREVSELGTGTTDKIFVDAAKLKYPLIVRKWEDGDYFFPFGMKGKKKLSKYFKDEKLSLVAKEKIWLLESDGQIVWIIGYRSDDRFKVDGDTDRILQITLNRNR